MTQPQQTLTCIISTDLRRACAVQVLLPQVRRYTQKYNIDLPRVGLEYLTSYFLFQIRGPIAANIYVKDQTRLTVGRVKP